MPVLDKPKLGDDSRLLHKDVRKLIRGINAMLNMTAQVEGRVRGMGRLTLRGSKAELNIRLSDPGDIASAKTTPIVTLTSSHNPSDYGSPVTFTANLLGVFSGTVTFLIDNSAVGVFSVVNQSANSGAISRLRIGDHTVLAVYSGDAEHNPAQSNPLTQTITGTVTLTLVSSSNPILHDNPVHWTATATGPVGSPTPTGTVLFYVDGTLFATRALIAGTCVSPDKTFTVGQVGTHAIHAHYSGDDNYEPKDITLTQQVLGSTTPAVDVTSSANPSNYGTSIHWQAVLSDSTATGQIQFKIDGQNFGGVKQVRNGIATSDNTINLIVGHHNIEAFYSGDATHNANSGSLNQVVHGTVAIDISSNHQPARPGDSVQWTIVVHPDSGTGNPHPTGTVSVYVDNVPYGTYVLDSNGNTISNIYIFRPDQAGQHNIHVHYNAEDPNYEQADGFFVQRVTGSAILSLTDTPNPAQEGQQIDFFITVSGTPTPTGTVQLRLNGGSFGAPVVLDGAGHAHYGVSSMGVGSYQMDFTYSGDGNYGPGTSPPVTQVVQAVAYTCVFALTGNIDNPVFGGQLWPATNDNLASNVVFVNSGTPDFPRMSLFDYPTFQGWDAGNNLVYNGACRVAIAPQDQYYNGIGVPHHGPYQEITPTSQTQPFPLYGDPVGNIPQNLFGLAIFGVPTNIGIVNYRCDVHLCVRLADGNPVLLSTGDLYRIFSFATAGF